MMSFREDPFVDVLADVGGEHPPGVGLGPRDVDEVVQEEVWASAPDVLRRHVEVVVVQHHDGIRVVADLLEHRSGEVAIDPAVAVSYASTSWRRMSGAFERSQR